MKSRERSLTQLIVEYYAFGPSYLSAAELRRVDEEEARRDAWINRSREYWIFDAHYILQLAGPEVADAVVKGDFPFGEALEQARMIEKLVWSTKPKAPKD